MGTVHTQALREFLDRDVIVACHIMPQDGKGPAVSDGGGVPPHIADRLRPSCA
ncbi:MAG TPA: hypothetical protein PLT20_07640 [Sedimentisphaerales bacterium]|nr:hypothetical protein [Sedimentisphaerales bacterium]